ncbi:MAG TPA: hypothetical protein VFR67_00140, partial [Pilimelia sp.]|nr:hypothetical protein [Pilimelia sp.]
WDMDVQLNGVGKAYAADVEFVKRQFEKHPASSYWIHNDQISSRSEGWRPRSYAYAGPDRNRHFHHVHFNSREQFEDSAAPWGILEEDVDLEDVVWTAPPGHPSGVPAGQRDIRDILAALDTRTALLTNGGYIKNLIDQQTAVLMAKLEEVLAAIAADPANNIQLTKDEVGELASLLNERMPSTEAIAEAVANELSRRLVH